MIMSIGDMLIGSWTTAKGFFKGCHGLRQGDPLSPYLFIMVVDLLERMIAKVEPVGLVEGFSPDGIGPTILFIQFADDFFMVKAGLEGVKNLRCMLLIMEVVTGLKMNWCKSTLSPVGVVSNVERLVEVLECEMVHLPITYLGLPLGPKSSSSVIWIPIIENMSRKLSS